jgi:hypothetical protein
MGPERHGATESSLTETAPAPMWTPPFRAHGARPTLALTAPLPRRRSDSAAGVGRDVQTVVRGGSAFRAKNVQSSLVVCP